MVSAGKIDEGKNQGKSAKAKGVSPGGEAEAGGGGRVSGDSQGRSAIEKFQVPNRASAVQKVGCSCSCTSDQVAGVAIKQMPTQWQHWGRGVLNGEGQALENI